MRILTRIVTLFPKGKQRIDDVTEAILPRDPYIRLHGKQYSYEETQQIAQRVRNGSAFTDQEAEVAVMRSIAPYRRSAASADSNFGQNWYALPQTGDYSGELRNLLVNLRNQRDQLAAEVHRLRVKIVSMKAKAPVTGITPDRWAKIK